MRKTKTGMDSAKRIHQLFKNSDNNQAVCEKLENSAYMTSLVIGQEIEYENKYLNQRLTYEIVGINIKSDEIQYEAESYQDGRMVDYITFLESDIGLVVTPKIQKGDSES